MYIKIQPAEKVSGAICVPGDKSISHRALMFSALATGESRLFGLSVGEDVRSTGSVISSLGANVKMPEGSGWASEVRVSGCGLRGFSKPEHILDAGNSGTTIRLMSGILAAQAFSCSITGDQYLCKRPMKRVLAPLKLMGADISASGEGYPPLSFKPVETLKPIRYELPVASAQVKSCVLLAGIHADGTTTVVESTPSRDHTERLLPLFGAPVTNRNGEISVAGNTELTPAQIIIPGDPSSAAFFAAAAAVLPGSAVTIENICLNPTRAAFFDVLEQMGARVERLNVREEAGEPVADIQVSYYNLYNCEVAGDILPSLIDEIPILAVVAAFAEGKSTIRDATELRVKETDRLAAMAAGLRSMGAKVEELEDGLVIEGGSKLSGAPIDSRGDHRIAMSFAVAGLAAKGETVIQDASCADISFPGFYDILKRISGKDNGY